MGPRPLPTKYTLQELNKMIEENSPKVVHEEPIIEKSKKDTYESSLSPQDIKYQDKDGVVVIKGKKEEQISHDVQDIELPPLATKMVLDQELAAKEVDLAEDKGFKKAG
jgi:hypothetical protein